MKYRQNYNTANISVSTKMSQLLTASEKNKSVSNLVAAG